MVRLPLISRVESSRVESSLDYALPRIPTNHGPSFLDQKRIKVMSFGKAARFISGNKQGIMNCVGMGIIFSYSIHNYRLKIAWDEHEVEKQKVEAENARLKSVLSDGEWQKEAGLRVRYGKTTLAHELSERLAEPVELSVLEKVQAQQKELDAIRKELQVEVGAEIVDENGPKRMV